MHGPRQYVLCIVQKEGRWHQWLATLATRAVWGPPSRESVREMRAAECTVALVPLLQKQLPPQWQRAGVDGRAAAEWQWLRATLSTELPSCALQHAQVPLPAGPDLQGLPGSMLSTAASSVDRVREGERLPRGRGCTRRRPPSLPMHDERLEAGDGAVAGGAAGAGGAVPLEARVAVEEVQAGQHHAVALHLRGGRGGQAGTQAGM